MDKVFENKCKLIERQLEYDLSKGKISKETYDKCMVQLMEMEFRLKFLKHIKLELDYVHELEALN